MYDKINEFDIESFLSYVDTVSTTI